MLFQAGVRRFMPRIASMAVVLAIVAGLARAQEPQSDATATTATSPAIQAVERDIEALTENGGLDAAARDELLAIYNETLEHLRAAAEWREQAATFERDRQQAPDRLEQVKAELQQAPAPPPTDAARNMELGELEDQLAQAEAELATARAGEAQLIEEREERNRQRVQLPQTIATARTRLDQLRRELEELPDDTAADADPTAVARRRLLEARIEATQREIEAYEKELQSYEARSRLLTARLDLAAQKLAQAERNFQFWQQWVAQARKSEAAQVVRETERVLERFAAAPAPIRSLAEQNLTLAQRRSGITGIGRQIEETEEELAELDAQLAYLRRDLESIQQKIETVGLNQSLGMLLRTRRSELPNIRQRQREANEREEIIADLQYQIFLLEEERSKLQDLEERTQEVLREVNGGLSLEERARAEEQIRGLLQQQKELLDSLTADAKRYFDLLVDIDAREQQLITAVEEYRNYINERVLWMASTSAVRFRDIPSGLEAALWLLDGRAWYETLLGLWRDFARNFLIYLSAFGALGLLARHQRDMKHNLRTLGEVAAKRTNRLFRPTIDALLYTLVLAGVWPLCTAFIGWRLNIEASVPVQGRAVGAGFLWASMAYYALNLVRMTMRPHGLGESHFKWPVATVGNLRRQLLGLITVGVPLTALVYAMQWQPEEAYQNSLGRWAFLGGMGMLSLYLGRIFKPEGILVGKLVAPVRGSAWDKMRIVWITAIVGIPLILAVMAALGYYYTALQLTWRFGATLALAFAATLVAGAIHHYIELTRVGIAREEARKRAKETSERGSILPEDLSRDAPQVQEERLDVSEINTQAERLLRLGTVVVLLAGIWFIWADVLPALSVFERVELWSTTAQVTETITGPEGEATVATRAVEEPVTLGGVLLAIIAIVLMVVLSNNISGLLEFSILRKFDLKSGERYAIVTIVRYTIMIIAVVMAFSIVGISWGSLQWLIAAMGVGLGFGLQEIFANFVSGMIILFERPVRVGDMVTVGDVNGTVSKIRIRATTIIDFDMRELVVPNKEFITTRVINWTLTDPVTRVTIPVGVAYGSDTNRAQEIMMQIAQDHPLIVEDPAPFSMFSGFGDNSLDLQLRVYIPTRDVWVKVVNDMHTQIHEAFMKENIVIAFPQRDVHIDSIGPLKVDPIQVRLVNGSEPTPGMTPKTRAKKKAAGGEAAKEKQEKAARSTRDGDRTS